VLVRRAYLDHSYVAAKGSATIKFLSLAEEDRDIVGISCLDTLADIGSYEKRLMEEDSVEFRICVWGSSFSVEVVDAYILKFTGLTSAAKCLDKDTWSACHAAQMDMVA
jgi:hypothetical protein